MVWSLLIRAHEQDLCKKHEREMAEMNAMHNRETQNMLCDFNKAQELLKDKISALQVLYVQYIQYVVDIALTVRAYVIL